VKAKRGGTAGGNERRGKKVKEETRESEKRIKLRRQQ
jgi:hypothetical protein